MVHVSPQLLNLQTFLMKSPSRTSGNPHTPRFLPLVVVLLGLSPHVSLSLEWPHLPNPPPHDWSSSLLLTWTALSHQDQSHAHFLPGPTKHAVRQDVHGASLPSISPNILQIICHQVRIGLFSPAQPPPVPLLHYHSWGPLCRMPGRMPASAPASHTHTGRWNHLNMST